MRVEREWECDGWKQSIESNQHFQISEVRTHTLSVPVNDQDRGGSDNLNAWRSDKKARHIRRKCEMFCSNRFLMARLFICLFVCFFLFVDGDVVAVLCKVSMSLGKRGGGKVCVCVRG